MLWLGSLAGTASAESNFTCDEDSGYGSVSVEHIVSGEARFLLGVFSAENNYQIQNALTDFRKNALPTSVSVGDWILNIQIYEGQHPERPLSLPLSWRLGLNSSYISSYYRPPNPVMTPVVMEITGETLDCVNTAQSGPISFFQNQDEVFFFDIAVGPEGLAVNTETNISDVLVQRLGRLYPAFFEMYFNLDSIRSLQYEEADRATRTVLKSILFHERATEMLEDRPGFLRFERVFAVCVVPDGSFAYFSDKQGGDFRLSFNVIGDLEFYESGGFPWPSDRDVLRQSMLFWNDQSATVQLNPYFLNFDLQRARDAYEIFAKFIVRERHPELHRERYLKDTTPTLLNPNPNPLQAPSSYNFGQLRDNWREQDFSLEAFQVPQFAEEGIAAVEERFRCEI